MNRMTPFHLSKPKVTPCLLPVEDAHPSLGATLLINAVRRAFAQLCVTSDIEEPDWPTWAQKMTESGGLPAQELLAPEQHIGCRLLEAHTETDNFEVRHIYRRSLQAEIHENLTIYFIFFEACGVPTAIQQSLRAQCEQERLLQHLERVLP